MIRLTYREPNKMTMDYKYIEQLLERYFNAETSLEEEQMLRTFFSQKELPADMQQWRALFTADDEEMLGDDFDARIMEAIAQQEAADEEVPVVKAREVTLTKRLLPLFKAAAVVAIILTLGGALQAPFDNSWNTLDDYASYEQTLDSVAAVSPVQAENITDVAADSTNVLLVPKQKQ